MRAAALLLALAGCVAAPAPDLRATLTAAQIEAIGGPLLLAEAPALGTAALLPEVAWNAATRTWASADGVSLSTTGGLIVATRGLGFDLLSADVSGTLAALAGGVRQDYPRLHSYLDGENRTAFRAFRCVMTSAGRETLDAFGTRREVTRLVETCYSTGDPIVNSYWVGEDGLPWRTRQWVSPEVGPVLTDLLRP